MKKTIMGIDLAFRLKWWQKFLVWLGFRNRWRDFSCLTIWKDNGDGTFTLANINHF